MTETTLTVPPIVRRFDFKRLLAFLFRPRQAIPRLAEEEKPLWLFPMLVITVFFLMRIIINGYFQARGLSMGQVTLPPDWQYWSPDMQNNYMQAQQVTQGPAFLYVIPATLGLVKFWLAWLIVGGLTHLASTLFGGRGKMASALNVVAWACLPFVLAGYFEDCLHPHCQTPHCQPGTFRTWWRRLFLVNCWQAWTFSSCGSRSCWSWEFGKRIICLLGKAIAIVAIVLVLALLAQAGVGSLTSKLGGMTITRMF